MRHGKPFIYRVSSGEMARDGYVFYLSENGVWLTENVPVKYLEKKRGRMTLDFFENRWYNIKKTE